MEPEADKSAGLMKIKVKTLGNTVYDLEMKPEALIRDMKAKLEELSETPANLQRLVFRGHMLKDEQSLSHHNVTDGSTVHLVMRPVDTSQPPPPTGGAERGHPFAGPMGAGFPVGGPNGVLNPNEFGSFIAGMLGSMGVQGAVQVMHTTIPMEWTPNMGGQGGQGRGRPGAQGPGSAGQMAADLAQRMSDQARVGAFQQHNQGQQGADAGQHPAHLFGSIAAWLSRLNDAGGARSWPNIELPYPDHAGGAPACSVQEFAEAARSMWELGGWAAEEPASAFLQSSINDVTFGRWLPDQAPNPQQAPPERSAQEQQSEPLHMQPHASADSSAEQRLEHTQSRQSVEGFQQPPQQGTVQHARAAGQPQQAEQHADGPGLPPQQQSHSVSLQMSGENPADLVAAIASALSNQERDSTDHLASGSASTGSMSSLVPPRTSEDTGVHAERDPRRNGMDNPFGAGHEPLHPQLALLTGYTLQRMLEETARHTQARVVPRMADICAALRRFLWEHHADILSGNPGTTDTLQREALRAANMLHAEGVLLMEEARAAAAAILALRDNSARPLMAASPLFLAPDGSRAGPAPIRARFSPGMRFPQAGRGGGQPGAPAGPTPGAQAGLGPGLPLPPGMLPHAAMPFAQFAMGGTPVRISHNNSQGGNNVTIQMGNSAAASMDMTPLVEAFENMMSSVPQLQQLFQARAAGQPGWAAQGGQGGQTRQGSQARQEHASHATAPQPAGSGVDPPAPRSEGGPAARSATAQTPSVQRPSALHTLALPVLQQAIPMLVSVLVSGQQARTGNPGPVVLEQQQTQEMHLPSFPGQAPPGAAPTQTANSAQRPRPLSAEQLGLVGQAQAAAAPGDQQMRVPTFVVNAGQPNEMEVDIQAEVSEGHPLPSQAAMQPLVAQIMRAVTGQTTAPAHQARQAPTAAQPIIAQPLPASQEQQQRQQHHAADTAGVSPAVHDPAVVPTSIPPIGPVDPSTAWPEEHSDDSDWETASEDVPEYHAPAAAESESAGQRQEGIKGGGHTSQRQDSKSNHVVKQQHPDAKQPGQKEGVQVLNSNQSSHSQPHAAAAAAAAAGRPDMRTSLDSGPRSFPLTDSPESFSAPGSPQPALRPGRYQPLQPEAPQALQQPSAPRGMGLALPSRPGQGGRGGRGAGRSTSQQALGATAGSQEKPAASAAETGTATTGPRGLGSTNLPGPGTVEAPSSLKPAPPPAEPSIERIEPPISGVASARGMGGAMGGGGGLAGMMSLLMQSPAMQQMADSLADRAPRHNRSQQVAAPDFASFVQDMMPVVGQMLGGLGQGGPSLGSGQRGSSAGGSMMQSGAAGNEFAALAELPPDQAALWRQRILEDRVRQAGAEAPQSLSEEYLSGSSNRHDGSGPGSNDFGEGFL